MNEILLTPGPVMIPEKVMQAMLKSNIHHRTSEFENLFCETLDLYQALVNSPTRPIFLACSGTGGMEAALGNTCKKGDKVLILNAGKFAERWTNIANTLGLSAVELKKEWGQTFNAEELESFFSSNTDATAIFCQYCETSTTALHNVPAIAQLITTHIPKALFIVDAITAVGALKIDQITDGIDILIAGSQKALMLPPGLALLTCTEKAWAKIESNPKTSLYFNLWKEFKEHKKNTTAYTPAISLIFALNAALKIIETEGSLNVYQRHISVAKTLRSGLVDLGFNLLAESCPCPSVTGGFPPNNIHADELRKQILKNSGIRLAGGQDHLKGKIIRVGHMGMVNETHITALLTSLNNIL